MTEQERAAALADEIGQSRWVDLFREDQKDMAKMTLIERALRAYARPIRAGGDLGNGLVAVPREPTDGIRALFAGAGYLSIADYPAMLAAAKETIHG